MFMLIRKEFNLLSSTKRPLSDIAHRENFQSVDTISEDENFRAEYVDGKDKYIISIESIDHSRTFQERPDTYHNYLYHYFDGNLIEQAEYMYEEELI